MYRSLSTFLVAIALVSSAAFAQEGPLRRAGQALDNAGKEIRYRVESEIARGQVTAQEREVLSRVSRRIEWDKQFVGSTLQLEVQPGGTVILRGSVRSDAVKLRAVDLVENTIGVTSVVDELAVVKEVKVIKAAPTARVIEVTPPVVVPAETKVVVPAETKIIVKP
jgi:hyperosmotically inducible periplasmic protein